MSLTKELADFEARQQADAWRIVRAAASSGSADVSELHDALRLVGKSASDFAKLVETCNESRRLGTQISALEAEGAGRAKRLVKLHAVLKPYEHAPIDSLPEHVSEERAELTALRDDEEKLHNAKEALRVLHNEHPEFFERHENEH